MRPTARAASVGLALLMAGCGQGAGSDEAGSPPPPLDPSDAQMYDAVPAILQEQGLPLCLPDQGSLPAPDGDPAAPVPHFRYLEGRVYELGSCEVPLEGRGELRVYRYADQGMRDEAARSSSARSARPDVMWTYGDRFLIEEWVFGDGATNPGFPELANTIHNTVSELPEARHFDPAAQS